MSIRQDVRVEGEADKRRWLADRGGALAAGPRNVNFCLSRHWGLRWGTVGREWLKKGGDRINTHRLRELVFNLVLVDLCFKGIEVPFPSFPSLFCFNERFKLAHYECVVNIQIHFYL